MCAIKTLIRSWSLLILCFSPCLFAMYIGSDTTPSREASWLITDTGPYGVLGAAALDGGISFADSNVSFTFNSYFPINSSMSLNGGSMNLYMDLNLTSSCDFPTTGTIYGNGYSVVWAPFLGTLSLPSTVGQPAGIVFNNVNVTFSSPIFLQAPLYFYGVCTLDGMGYSLDLGSAGGIYVAPGSSLYIQNVTILDLSGTNISCLDPFGVINFDSVTCQLASNFTFSQGSLVIAGDAVMTGTYAFVYTSSQQSTVSTDATWYFDSGMTFSYAPIGGAKNLLNFQDSSATLYLYETTLYAPATGLSLLAGTLTVDGNCPVFSNAVTYLNGIFLGDGVNALNDMSPNILPESGLQIMRGYLVNNNV